MTTVKEGPDDPYGYRKTYLIGVLEKKEKQILVSDWSVNRNKQS